MAYDEQLAERIRRVLAARPDVSERKMFGGIAFMVNGNMACGVIKNELMVRVGPDAHDAAMARPNVRIMDFAHRPVKGMLYVEVPGIAADADLAGWVEQGADFAATLPPK